MAFASEPGMVRGNAQSSKIRRPEHKKRKRSSTFAGRMAPAGNSINPIHSAKLAGLQYVSDATPGIRRIPAGKHFRYLDAHGKVIRQPRVLNRIQSVVIPPAWTDVWICPSPQGHLQATGRDARGRKQYRYHPRWREVRDQTKYDRMVAFAHALARIRKRTLRDLALSGLPREKVLATVVRLLETTLIRVGNEEYVRSNESFGLTTMRDRHVDVKGPVLRFEFRGKRGIKRVVHINDRRLARIVKRCQDIPGQELFQYIDDNEDRHTIGSREVNDYLRQITGQDFTAKDFRTWAGTVLAAQALQEFQEYDSQAQAKKNVVRAIEAVAKRLGNRRTICRKCYVHPAVIEAYMDGSLLRSFSQTVEEELLHSLHELTPEEAAVLAFLQRRLRKQKAGSRNGSGKN